MTESIRMKESLKLEEEHEIEGEILKTLYYEIKPLAPEDAKLKLEERPQDKFLTFINLENNKSKCNLSFERWQELWYSRARGIDIK